MDEDEEGLTVYVTGVRSDEGTLVVLQGETEDGAVVTFAAAHRPAQGIVEALQAGESVEAWVPFWAILGGPV